MPLSADQTADLRLGLASRVNALVDGAIDGFIIADAIGSMAEVDVRSLIAGFGADLVPTPTMVRELVTFKAVEGEAEGVVDGVMPLWTTAGATGVGIAFRCFPIPHLGLYRFGVVGFVSVTKSDPGLTDADPGRSPAVERRASQRRLAEHPVPDRWRPVLATLVHRLVAGDYLGLAADGLVWFTDDPTDESVGDFIEMYPDKLVEMPAHGWLYSEHRYNVQDDGSWSAYVPLWTVNESPSDLTMEAVVWDDGVTVTAKISMVHAM